jgi:hypothetical protein
MAVLVIVICFQHSKWMPMNANWCVTSRGYPGPLFSISLYHYQVKDNWIVGDMVCSANRLLYSCLGLVWISYWTVRGALLCSCRLFAPHFSAIDSLQECSSLFEELKGGTAFAGYAAGRRLCMYPYFDCHFYFFNSFAVLAGTCVNFIPNSEGSLALFLSVVCPTLFCNR